MFGGILRERTLSQKTVGAASSSEGGGGARRLLQSQKTVGAEEGARRSRAACMAKPERQVMSEYWSALHLYCSWQIKVSLLGNPYDNISFLSLVGEGMNHLCFH